LSASATRVGPADMLLLPRSICGPMSVFAPFATVTGP